MILSAWCRRRLSALINQRISKAIDQAANSDAPPEASDLTVGAYEILEAQSPSLARHELLELRCAATFQPDFSRLDSARASQARLAE